MLGKKKTAEDRSVLGAGLRVQGRVEFSGHLQIDGSVDGDVLGDTATGSTVVVTASGVVRGAMRASHVVVAGHVMGPIQSFELLELQATARVHGDLQYKALEMQRGASVAGQLQPQLLPPPALGYEADASRPQLEPTLDGVADKS